MNPSLSLSHPLWQEPGLRILLQRLVQFLKPEPSPARRIEPKAPVASVETIASEVQPQSPSLPSAPVIPLHPRKVMLPAEFEITTEQDEAVSDKAIEILLGRGSTSPAALIDDLLPHASETAATRAFDLKVARAILLHVIALDIRHVARMTGFSEATILAILNGWREERLEKAA
ncbi:hypothetical protein [Beijerinckia mobilis]|uniref:hypothetical protein n=1 Tax=Beijerinckia mobilis TaxID=231434 RepID=UPI00054ECCAD|nr:hypothetical protein [Beijerinckia mobilis]